MKRMTMKRYDELVKRAAQMGACSDAIEWLRKKRRTMDQMISTHPKWVMWLAGEMPDENLLTPAQIDAVAKRVPLVALIYAIKQLTPARVAYCEKRIRWTAAR